MISLNSARSASEYRCVGPVISIICVSKTDFVNSGSYFTALFVVVLGITTFAGFGGSFFIIGFALGFIETRVFGSNPPFFATGAAAGFAGTAGLATGF